MALDKSQGARLCGNLFATTSLAALALALTTTTAASQIVWTGATSTDWFTGSNWQGGVTPIATWDAAIDTGSAVIGSAGAVSRYGIIGNNANTHGMVTVDGPTSTWTTSLSLFVGALGTGTLNISNGGTVTSVDGLLGFAASSTGIATITGTNSTWTMSGNLHVGESAVGTALQSGGTLTISSGGTVNDVGGLIGNLVNSTGTVKVDGTGSVWTNSSFLAVGNNGTGTLAISNGGKVVNTNAWVGSYSGSNGIVTVDGNGSKWTNSGDLYVGSNGTGTLAISNGGTVTSVQGFVGGYSGSIGTATVSGANSTWTMSANLLVGNAATGTPGTTDTLKIQNGGTVSSFATYIGNAAGSTGTITVDGTNSSLTSPGGIGVGASGNGVLTIQNGGRVVSGDPSDAAVIGWHTGSTGTVTVDGAGSTWTHNNDLYVGFDGTAKLTISNGGAVSNFQGLIGWDPGANNTVSVTGAGSTWTNSSNLAVGQGGTGTLTISNGGTVTSATGLIGNNTGSYGTATVDGAGSSWTVSGNLAVGNNGTGTLTISNGGTVSAASATIAAGGAATGTLIIGAAAGQAPVAPGTLVTPTVTFGLGTGGIVFNHTASNYVFAPIIAGLGTVTVDAGTTILTAANTYTGATIVNGGTLEVDGSIANSSAVTVNAGGTLSGTGTVDPPATTAIAGTLAPGSVANPTGTLTITGNLAFQSGAFYLVHLTPLAAASTNISGTATLTGGTVQTVFAPGSYVGRSYDILHAAGGLGGTSFTGASSALPGFNVALSYTPTDVLLNLTASLAGTNINQQNAANVINNFFNGGGALPPGFLTLFGNNQANGLSLVSGEVATGAQQGAFQLGGQFLNLLLDPFADGRGGAGGGGALGFAPERETLPDDIALAYAKAMGTPAYKAPVAFEPQWTAWGGAYGGYNTTKGDAAIGSHDMTARAGGVAAGLDYRLSPDGIVGFGLAGGTTNWSLAPGLGGGRSDAFQAGLYGKTRSGPLYLAGAFAFTDHWMSTDRTALGDHLTADFTAQSFGGRIESGYRFATPVVAVTPYAAVQAQSFRNPFYSETDVTGGGFGLSYNARNATDTRSELGSRFDRVAAVTSDTTIVLRSRLAWAHDWVSDPSAAAIFQTLPGQSFIVNGARPAADSALASVGAEWRFANGVTLAGKFDGEFASRASTYAGTGTLRVAW